MVNRLRAAFPKTVPQDLREKPHHGYRAVHFVVRVDGKRVEIQIRSTLQHLWAQLSEKLADEYGVALKYGRGPRVPRQLLRMLSEAIAETESLEEELAESTRDVDEDILEGQRQRLADVKAGLKETLGQRH